MTKTGIYKDPNYMKKYREKNKTKLNTNLSKWRKNKRRQVKHYNLKHFYGITIDEYDELCAKQLNRCGICEKETKLVVDHCHKTGAIRGLLCSPCNLAIGSLGDTLESLTKAVNYLKKEYG